MMEDELEKRIRSVRHRPLPAGLKERVLAYAEITRRPSLLRLQRWLAAGLAAAWLVIFVLHFSTPHGAGGSFTQAALAKAGPQPGAVPMVNAAALFVANAETLARSLR